LENCRWLYTSQKKKAKESYMRMKQFTMQIEACEGTTLQLSGKACCTLVAGFYFLILIDELLANAAGDYLLEGEKKFGINSECNRSYLDVLAAHTQTKTRSCLHEKRNLKRGKNPGGLHFCKSRVNPDLESSQRKTVL
ncbi:hypothetical protein HispidOSU_016693, partial [Sigmodon hispidus]